jgi:hypothetical protein
MRLSLPIGLVALLGFACNVTTSTDMVFDSKAPPTDAFSSIQQVFDESCATRGCHADVEYPNLSAGQSYASLVGKPSTAGPKLVAPAQPDSSYLYIKIAGRPGMLGRRMPYGKPPLPDTTIAAIRSWIERGAPND